MDYVFLFLDKMLFVLKFHALFVLCPDHSFSCCNMFLDRVTGTSFSPLDTSRKNCPRGISVSLNNRARYSRFHMEDCNII